MKRSISLLIGICAVSLIFIAFPAAAAPHEGAETDGPHAITFDDLFSMGRLGGFEISPDGKNVAFTVTWFDKDSNSSNSDIYIVPLTGGEARGFALSPAQDYSPCWSPDGKQLAFISTREGSPQIWVIPTGGGEARRITDVPTGASGPLWSPDGKTIAFYSSVFPDCPDMDCNAKKLKEREASGIKARLTDHLLYRHWNAWRDGQWSHLFLTGLDGKDPVEINKGRTDVPPIALGGSRDYDFSPDGREICFTMNPDPVVAVSTNNDLYILDIEEGTTRQITASNPANDNSPRYSPDGRYIAYVAMARAGFEADRSRLMLYDRKSGKTSSLTENLDYSIGNFDWAPDSKWIYFCTEDKGRYSIGRVSTKGNDSSFIITGSFDDDLRVSPDGRHIVFARQDIRTPFELYTATTKGKKIKQLTSINRKVLDGIVMNKAEDFWFTGAEGRKVHGMIVKPPFFEEGKKYPMILLIHGGPQGAFGDEFHFRWNVQMFASPGYVVATVNFTGSTGYGQAFTDSISGDWGGAPYKDIMLGLNYIVNNFDYIDSTRVGAAGASYGGYMIDWLEGHTDRFLCLVSHAGVYDLTSMFGATEELWFPMWEFKGTPWTNPEMYRKFSPSSYVKNFKTPCLVITGENDFRVPYTQSLQFFTALQLQGVPSKLLVYPDEYHFVTKPLNAELWWNTLYDWFAEYLQKD